MSNNFHIKFVFVYNLLLNAIEASEKIEEEKRKIDITFSYFKNHISITVQNSCISGKMADSQMFLFTDKEDKVNHGIGIENVRKKMQKKPDIEPPSTKSLKLLMDKRRKDLEERKKREESVKLEDEARFERQQRLNHRVRSSSVIRGNKKQLDEKRKEDQKAFKEKIKRDKDDYNVKLKAIKQNVENRPLMMEVAGRKEDVIDMKQDEGGKI